MEILREGVAAFFQAAGIAAVLWVLFDWLLYPRRVIHTPVYVPLSGDAQELDRLLRRLEGLHVTLLDEGLSLRGAQRAQRAVDRRPNTTLMKRGEEHGRTGHH